MLLLKLYALPSLYRQGNLPRVALYEIDILTLIHQFHPPLAPLFAELAHHLSPSDLKELRRVVDGIERRIAGFGGAFKGDGRI